MDTINQLFISYRNAERSRTAARTVNPKILHPVSPYTDTVLLTATLIIP